MELVVRLTATLDELARIDDRYERELQEMLEYVAAKLERLTLEERRAFVAHVAAMSASAATDPLVSPGFREFLAEFAVGFGLTDAED